MAADPQGHDPRTLWRDQDPETDPVTLEQIHDLARKMDRRTRLTPPVMALSLMFVGAMTGFVWIHAHDLLGRAIAILSAAGCLGCYIQIYRLEFPFRDPAEPSSAHLRRRLQRSLAFRTGGWVLAVLPMAPAVLLGAYRTFHHGAGHFWLKAAPFLIFAAAMAFIGVRNRLNAPKTRARLRELDDLMGR